MKDLFSVVDGEIDGSHSSVSGELVSYCSSVVTGEGSEGSVKDGLEESSCFEGFLATLVEGMGAETDSVFWVFVVFGPFFV